MTVERTASEVGSTDGLCTDIHVKRADTAGTTFDGARHDENSTRSRSAGSRDMRPPGRDSVRRGDRGGGKG